MAKENYKTNPQMIGKEMGHTRFIHIPLNDFVTLQNHIWYYRNLTDVINV